MNCEKIADAVYAASDYEPPVSHRIPAKWTEFNDIMSSGGFVVVAAAVAVVAVAAAAVVVVREICCYNTTTMV